MAIIGFMKMVVFETGSFKTCHFNIKLIIVHYCNYIFKCLQNLLLYIESITRLLKICIFLRYFSY